MQLIGVKHHTREEWLQVASQLLRKKLEEHGNLPDKLHILTSWPYGTKKAIGQCYSKSWTKDESTYIAISPKLNNDDIIELLGVLIHELIHAMVGVEKNHGKAFKKVAIKVGLQGSMRATEVGDVLRKDLEGFALKLGTYPHQEMQPPPAPERKPAKKQIIKFVSPTEPSYSCWVTPAQAAIYGPPICPISKQLMVKPEDNDEGGD